MKIQRLDKSHSEQMSELFRADRFSLTSDFYIDRGKDFYACYDWFEKEKFFSWGAFDGDELIGMTSLVRLPIFLDSENTEIYLNTDFYVHPEYRKSLAAGRLLKALQVDLPHSNIFEIGIEQEPGFLDQLPRYSKHFNHETIWLKDSELLQVYPFKMSKNYPYHLKLSQDFSLIESYWEKYFNNFNDTAILGVRPGFKISNAPGVNYFSIATEDGLIEGLLFDKSRVQKIRWNGLPRVNIEKYKRSQDLPFSVDDELKIFNIGFLSPLHLIKNSHQVLWDCLINYAFSKKYFSWSVRDFKFIDVKANGNETTSFIRRIPFTGQKLSQLNSVKNTNCNLKRITLESVFV